MAPARFCAVPLRRGVCGAVQGDTTRCSRLRRLGHASGCEVSGVQQRGQEDQVLRGLPQQGLVGLGRLQLLVAQERQPPGRPLVAQQRSACAPGEAQLD